MGATNILKAKVYELIDDEKVPIIKNWQGRKGLQLSLVLIKDHV